MAYSPAAHSLTGKAMGFSQATSTDARSLFYDAGNFKQRPYVSTAEVLAELVLPKNRFGNFPIFINSTGILNPDGTITGGVLEEWWFKDGVADGDLVLKTSAGGATDPPFPDLATNDWDGEPFSKELSATTDLTLITSRNSGMGYVKQDSIGGHPFSINGVPLSINLGPHEPSGVHFSTTDFGRVFGWDNDFVLELATPLAPTTPVTDDTANTYGWSDTGGKTFADAEYTVNGGTSWTDATANPQTGIGNVNKPTGQVGVRYKAVAGVSNASAPLYNTVAFLITPAAPTSGVVDDTLDTFDWTNTAGFSAASDYEYRVGGTGGYTTVPAKPLPVGDINIAIGDLELRVKEVAGVNTASAPLTNATAFTSSLPTPAAPTAPVTDDTLDTFDWTYTPGYTTATLYEYRVGGAGAWTAVTAKPISVGDVAIGVGDLEVRVAANPGVNNAGLALTNTVAFTTAGGGYDADAQAYLTAHSALGTPLSVPEQDAVNARVLAYKANGTWAKKDIIYLHVGTNNAAQHGLNLKNPSAFPVTWAATAPGFSANGVDYAGGSGLGYGDTGYNCLTHFSATDAHMAFYSRTSGASTGQVFDIGASTDAAPGHAVDPVWLICRHPGDICGANFGSASATTAASTDGDGCFVASRQGGDTVIYRNGIELNRTTTVAAFPNQNLYIGAANGGGAPGVNTNKECALVEIGPVAHTTAEILQDYVDTQTFQTAFSRQVT